MTARCCWLAALGLALASASPATCADARTDRFGDPLPDGAVARMGTIRFRHSGDVRLVSFLPDGETIVSIGKDAVRWWDAATGNEIRRRPAPSGLGWTLAASPDRKGLAMDDGDDVVLCDAATGKERARLRADGGRTFSPNGRLLATCSDNLQLWNAETGERVRDLDHHVTAVSYADAAFLPDGKTLVTTGNDGVLRWWDVESGKVVHEAQGPKECGVHLAVAPDGRRLATVGRDDTLRLWDAGQRTELRVLRSSTSFEGTSCIGFSPDCKLLAAGGGDCLIRIYDAVTGDELRRCEGHQDAVWSLSFSPDGATLVSGGADSAVRQWDVATGKEIHPFAGQCGQVGALAVSSNGATVASAGNDRRVHLWNAVTGEERRSLDGARGDMVRFLGIAPDGRTVTAVCRGRGVVRVWDAADGKELRSFSLADKGYREAFALSPAATVVAASNTWRNRIALFDAAKGEIIHEYQEEGFISLQPGAFLGAGKTMALFRHSSGNESKTDAFLLWDVGTGGHELRPVWGDGDPGGCDCTASSDGKVLAVPSFDGSVALWNAISGDPIRGWNAENGDIWATAFSADGRTMATGHRDGTVVLWETASGFQRGALRGGQGAIRALAFSPDGRRLYTGGSDGTVLAWNLTQRAAGFIPADLNDKALEKLWDDLAGGDGVKAYQAVWALAAAPERSVPFLKGRLHQTVATPGQIAGWIMDLDSDDFDTREKASAELRRQGGVAESALITALAAKPSPEVRQRIVELLGRLNRERMTLHPSDVRLVRALEALEDIGTPAARDVLTDLADGPDTALGREAKASLERLQRRKN